jgi:cell division protein FtsZ
LSEVEILMRELGRHVRDHTQIVFGTAVDGKMGNRLSVTIISSLASEDSIATEAPAAPPLPEPFLAPPPAALEQIEEPPAPPKIDPPSPNASPARTYGVAGITPEPEIAASAQPAPGDLIPFEKPVAAEPPPPSPAPSIKKPAPRLIPPKKKPVLEKEAKPPMEKYVQAKQEVLQFEPVTRGRFEKSEPTIVEGQDLDIPTFMRKNIRVK